ncbi:MAG: hypothetical protein SFW35_09865 [Chitinophagales bacterium]|nr:hypothetical protein [Chitinophagales bacterium]
MAMFVRKLAITLLLFFNGSSAIYGGFTLMKHPDGSAMQFPPQLLERIPFHDYFIPGLILFSILGIGSIVAVVLLFARSKWYTYAAMAVGCANIIWIITQIAMIRELSFLQGVYFAIGAVLLVLGAMEQRLQRFYSIGKY